MKKILFILFLTFSILSCKEKLEKELIFFENIDFDSGDYKIYVFASEGTWIDDYMDFVIEDIETLNEIKERWVFKEKLPPTACGYGYNLKLVDKEKIIKSFSINIDCEYMTGWIVFPKEYLSDYKHSFIKLNENQIQEFNDKYKR